MHSVESSTLAIPSPASTSVSGEIVRRANGRVSECIRAGWLSAAWSDNSSSGALGNDVEMLGSVVAPADGFMLSRTGSMLVEPTAMGAHGSSTSVLLICCADALESDADCGGVWLLSPCLRAVCASGVCAPSGEQGKGTSFTAVSRASVADEVGWSVARDTVLSFPVSSVGELGRGSCFDVGSTARCRVGAGGVSSDKSVTEPSSDDPTCAEAGEDADAITFDMFSSKRRCSCSFCSSTRSSRLSRNCSWARSETTSVCSCSTAAPCSSPLLLCCCIGCNDPALECCRASRKSRRSLAICRSARCSRTASSIVSCACTRAITSFARSAKASVRAVSSAAAGRPTMDGETVAIMSVRVEPPSESCKTRVSGESRNGM